MRNYLRKPNGYRWSNLTIKNCIHFQARNPGTYESMRRSQFLSLPCRRTLQGYVGGREGEIGFTYLAKERLKLEMKRLNRFQRVISIVIDEVTLRYNVSTGLLPLKLRLIIVKLRFIEVKPIFIEVKPSFIDLKLSFIEVKLNVSK